MDDFIKKLESERIFAHDKMQLELKSEFIPSVSFKQELFIQELYFFIPNSLDINPLTYSKEDFYQDRVNFIRYKTPVFSLQELINKNNTSSPLCRIEKLVNTPPLPEEILIDELKLLANTFSSTLREQIKEIYQEWQDSQEKVYSYCLSLNEMQEELFARLEQIYLKLQAVDLQLPIKKTLHYSEEHTRGALLYYLTGLLNKVNSEQLPPHDDTIKLLQKISLHQKSALRKLRAEPEDLARGSKEQEYFLYRQGLLNKFIYSSLFLLLQQKRYDTRLHNFVGGLAAAFAMLFYFLLFVWQGTVFVINSQPFILATVILYVLKDRLKEAIKTFSYKKASRWFPDQRTIISSPKSQRTVGSMTEGYTPLPLSSLSKEVQEIRDKEFHYVLEDIKRPETVLHYKKTVQLEHPSNSTGRRNCLNIIFRYNIQKLLRKADNPFHPYLTFNSDTLKLQTIPLPKVYHINIIMKNTTFPKGMKAKVEYKKFRLIVNKKGIMRIEQVRS